MKQKITQDTIKEMIKEIKEWKDSGNYNTNATKTELKNYFEFNYIENIGEGGVTKATAYLIKLNVELTLRLLELENCREERAFAI